MKATKAKPKKATIYSIIFLPWHKYSEFFDNGCWGIWGLSHILKFTFLYFAVFFIPPIFGWVKTTDDSSVYFGIFMLAFLVILLIWLLYLPVLTVILLYRLAKQMKLIASQTVNLLREAPWDMTPKNLYAQSHWAIVVYLLNFKDSILDISDWLSQFYPLSVFSTSNLKYPFNIKIRRNIRVFEAQMAYMQIPLKCVDFEINPQNATYKFEFYEEVKNISKYLKKLEKQYQDNSGAYVRQEDDQINVIVPHAKRLNL